MHIINIHQSRFFFRVFLGLKLVDFMLALVDRTVRARAPLSQQRHERPRHVCDRYAKTWEVMTDNERYISFQITWLIMSEPLARLAVHSRP